MIPTIFDPAQPVFIVGPGASLTDFDFGRLRRRQVIAVDLAYRVLPNADVMFFADNGFWDENQAPDGIHFPRFGSGRIFTTAAHCGGMAGRVQFVRTTELAAGEIDDKSLSAGAQAILLAKKLGAEKIVLLGFDGKPGRWSDDRPYRSQAVPGHDAFKAEAESFAQVAALGLDVANATPGSALTAFQTVDPDTLF